MRNGYTECSLPEQTCCWMTSNGQMIVVKKANFTKSMNPMLCLLAPWWDYLPCYVLCVRCFPWRRIYTKRLEARVIYKRCSALLYFNRSQICIKIIHRPTIIKKSWPKAISDDVFRTWLSRFPSATCIGKTLCHFRCLLATVNISRYFSYISEKRTIPLPSLGICLFPCRDLMQFGTYRKNKQHIVFLYLDII